MAVTLFAKNGGIDVQDGCQRRICAVKFIIITRATKEAVNYWYGSSFAKLYGSYLLSGITTQ